MADRTTPTPHPQALNPFLNRLTQLSPNMLMAAFFRYCHLSPALFPGDRQSLGYSTEGLVCFWRFKGALSHSSACHDGLLETLELQVRLGEGK